jgi:hypothetical protein
MGTQAGRLLRLRLHHTPTTPHLHTPHSIKERLQARLAESGSAVISQPMDWRVMGVPEWLADRAERLGLLFPTGVCLGAACGRLAGAHCKLITTCRCSRWCLPSNHRELRGAAPFLARHPVGF